MDLGTQLGQLTVAAAEVMKSAKLDVPAAVSIGGQGKVVLTLPWPPIETAAGTSSLALFITSAAATVSWPSWVPRSTAGAAAACAGVAAGAVWVESRGRARVTWSSGLTGACGSSTGCACWVTTIG